MTSAMEADEAEMGAETDVETAVAATAAVEDSGELPAGLDGPGSDARIRALEDIIGNEAVVAIQKSRRVGREVFEDQVDVCE